MKQECFNCEQAQLGPWRSYSGKCPECIVRQIANTDSGARDPIYERIQAECGRGALERVKELVGNEIVRQRLLRERLLSAAPRERHCDGV